MQFCSRPLARVDQFQDYEHRGRVFKEIVQRLAVEEEAAESARRLEEAARILAPAAPSEAAPATLPEPVAALGPSKTTEPVMADVLTCEPITDTEAASADAAVESAGLVLESAPVTEEDRPPAEIKHPERVYVYEVNAEEIVYADSDTPAGPPENGDVDVIVPGDLASSESADDEVLPFEVRGGARVPSPSSVGEATVAADSGEAQPEESAKSAPDGVKRQARLPGL